MTKKFKISCIIILLLSLFIFECVNADSGWDGSYDSGSSSWSSSSDWGSSSDRSSSNSGSGVYISGDVDFTVVLIVFILILVVAYLGTKKTTSNSINSFEKQPIIPFDIEKIKEVIPNFNKDQFKNQTYEIYKNIQTAWMNFDYDTLRKNTTDELYNTYKSQLSALSVKNQKNIMKDFEIKDFEITNMEAINGMTALTVRMLIDCYDYVVDKDNKTIRGNDSRKVRYDYQMTFNKGISKKENKCPSCNAPLENINSSKCSYCDSTIIGENYDWILAKKMVIKQTENKNML